MYRLSEKASGLQLYEVDTAPYRIRLDANESFLDPTPADREAMTRAAGEVLLRRYPDPANPGACGAVARLYGVPEELVVSGNGSDELISVIVSSLLE